MRSLPHSKHDGRGVQTQARQSWQRCMTSFCCAAVSQNGHRATTEIFAVGENAQSRNQSNLCVGDLSIAAFTAQLPYPLQDVQSSTRGGWLATIDHAAARLNRQLSFEREVGSFEVTEIALGAKAEILDLQVNDDDVIVVKLEKIDVAVFYARHLHRHLARVFHTHHERVGSGPRAVRGIAPLAKTFEIDGAFAQLLSTFRRRENIGFAAVCRQHTVK